MEVAAVRVCGVAEAVAVRACNWEAAVEVVCAPNDHHDDLFYVPSDLYRAAAVVVRKVLELRRR